MAASLAMTSLEDALLIILTARGLQVRRQRALDGLGCHCECVGRCDSVQEVFKLDLVGQMQAGVGKRLKSQSKDARKMSKASLGGRAGR